jgi:ribosomal protein S18 acetylase RimI-like enzyme
LAEIHVRGWQAAYRGILTSAFLDSLSIPDRTEWWKGRLQLLAGKEAVLVADVEGSTVGFVLIGPATAKPEMGEAELGEIWAIYLDPAYWRRGIGGALLTAAADHLAGSGFAEAILWVLENNTPARTFYEAMGWQLDPNRSLFKLGGLDVTEVRYRRPL